MEKSFQLKILIGTLVFSAGFLILDVFADFLEHFQGGTTYSLEEVMHMVFEIIAVIGLIAGVFLGIRHMQFLRRTAQQNERALTMFRGQFDEVAVQQFQNWGLSEAERDVALMTLRGLPLADIAKARATSVGTIKAQTNAIFRKSGLGSRTEFLSHFLDEFLDRGMQT